jgi:hypothetical protein
LFRRKFPEILAKLNLYRISKFHFCGIFTAKYIISAVTPAATGNTGLSARCSGRSSQTVGYDQIFALSCFVLFSPAIAMKFRQNKSFCHFVSLKFPQIISLFKNFVLPFFVLAEFRHSAIFRAGKNPTFSPLGSRKKAQHKVQEANSRQVPTPLPLYLGISGMRNYLQFSCWKT